MSDQTKFYQIYLDSADSDETSPEKIQNQLGHIAVFDDGLTLGYTIYNNDISFAIYGTYLEGIGMMLSTRNFRYDFSAEKRIQTFVNKNDSNHWYGDIFKCNNGELICYDKVAKTKSVEILDKDSQSLITQNLGAVLDYIQKNSPETWLVITMLLNGGNTKNKKYIESMKSVYESKSLPEIFKQSQPGDN